MTRYPYAARLNSFVARPELFWPGRSERLTTLDLVERAATVDGLTAVDLNYPQQAAGLTPREWRARLDDLGLLLNGFAMRYNGDPAFVSGALTNADPAIRRRAIDLSRRGLDEAREAGGSMLTLWLGQDGIDHPFEREYGRLWDLEVEGIRAIAEHDPGFPVSIEYKPNEPRARSVLPNIASTLLAIDEAAADNLGITLDFAHVLYGDESPAMALALVQRRSRMLGLHINDGYGKRDDGLMVGAVHTVQTLEFLRQLRRGRFEGTIYFDTFPEGAALDPVSECAANIATIEAMFDVIERMPVADLDAALERGDAVAAQRIVQRAMFRLDD